MKALQTLGLSQREACAIVRARRRSRHEKPSTKALDDARWATRLPKWRSSTPNTAAGGFTTTNGRDAIPDQDEYMNYKRFRRIYRLANLQIGDVDVAAVPSSVRGRPLRRATKPFEGWTLDFHPRSAFRWPRFPRALDGG